MEECKMAEISELKRIVLSLSDDELISLFGIKKKNNNPQAISNTKNHWFDNLSSGLTKEGERKLEELEKQLCNPVSAHHVDRKLLRYLKQLKKMHIEVPPLFHNIVNPKEMYKHLISFCKSEDIPEEIVARIVPALVTYIETGYMRPVIFVGEKGCGKTKSTKLLIEKALQIPTEIIKVPQMEGSQGLTGNNGTYQSADVGCIAKARLRNNSLLVAYIFDEIDKTAHNPHHANLDEELLSITDESCSDIYDNYLETTLIGLQHCPIFFTANDLQKISPILADRCTIIKFPNANASRIKSISRKYIENKLSNSLYSLINFDYNLMNKYIDNLVRHNITSIRKHQQMIEAVLENARNLALTQDVEEIVNVTENMFINAEHSILGTIKQRTGFSV